MSIKNWPITERPRERLMEHGPRALSDGELVAVLISCGHRGRSAVELARRLIAEFGSLREFLAADRIRCLKQLGIGPARYAALQAALELARRHYRQSMRLGLILREPHTTREFLRVQLRDKPCEVFCCLHLDNRYRLLAFQELFQGTLNGSTVHTREVVRAVLNHNAAAVIFAHNHPSGEAEASEADRLLTQRLRDALSPIDVRVLDHVIVGDTRCFSFAERGLL